MGMCDNDRKGQSIIEEILFDQKGKIQVLENILNCQAKTKEYHSLYLDTAYVIHRML